MSEYLNPQAARIDARRKAEALAFVEFVLRHTLPERAKAHGHETVHSLIKFHPFAQNYGPSNVRSEEGK